MAKSGAIQAAVQNQATTQEPQTIRDYINRMAPAIARALPSVITPERFTRMVLTAISNTPELASAPRRAS